MLILTINCGSSSIKISLYDFLEKQVLLNLEKDRLSSDQSLYLQELDKLLQKVVLFSEKELKKEIHAVVHRMVHGGDFREPVLINKQVIKKIGKFSNLAPLHNPFALLAISETMKLFKCPNFAVFDTAYYQDLDEINYLYALPKSFYLKNKIRRYGFHGLSHKYSAKIIGDELQNDSLKIISCHLGNGASVTASIGLKARATSMGFTPMEGLTMGTRSGDIDPGIIFYLVEELGLPLSEVKQILNKKSGILGLSNGLGSDMRDFLYPKNTKFASVANLVIDFYSYKLAQKISSFIPSLGDKPDVISFTGGIGQNSAKIREKTLSYLQFLDWEIDEGLNKKNALIFSKKNSSLCLMAIPANEDLAMCGEIASLIT